METKMCYSFSTEYERKFAYSEDTEMKLVKLGAALVKHQILKDVYYDTVDDHFALHNHWLRNRNHSWELKFLPFDDKQLGNKNVGNIAKYHEMTTESEIKKVLSSLLNSISETKLATKILDKDLTNMVKLDEFKILAQFRSTRKTYSIENLTIDLDETDVGFRVGEIECLVHGDGTDSEAVNTTERINKMAAILGVPNEKTYGKLETYLKMKNPELLQKLITRGILSNT